MALGFLVERLPFVTIVAEEERRYAWSSQHMHIRILLALSAIASVYDGHNVDQNYNLSLLRIIPPGGALKVDY